MSKNNSNIPITFPGVDVVEASAGSGKTYALAKRFIQLLMHPGMDQFEDPLKSVMAVTFTNKATVEMRSRMIEFLKRIALDDFKDKDTRADILGTLEVSPAQAAKKAVLILDAILENYGSFQVRTMDSFVNTLIKSSAFHLGLSPRARIKDEYRPYLEFALERTIDRVDTDKGVRKALERFLDYYIFVEQRDGWFSRKDMIGLLDALFNFSTSYGGEFSRSNVKLSDIMKMEDDLVAKVNGLVEVGAPEGVNMTFWNGLDNFSMNGFSKGLSASFDKDEFKMKKGYPAPKGMAALWDPIRKGIIKYVEAKCYDGLDAYIEMFDIVRDDMRAIAGEDEVIFLPELNVMAGKLFKSGGIDISELYYRLQARIRHYLIDEFQDTSKLQWANFEPLVEEALSNGGTLFYVGDKKQAIFGFRGGTSLLFDGARQSFRSFEPRIKALDKNYRSRENIVNFNNNIFSYANITRLLDAIEERKNIQVIFSVEERSMVLDAYHGARQSFKEGKEGGFVRYEILDADEAAPDGTEDRGSDGSGEDIGEEEHVIPESMREKIGALISDITARYTYADIAILARTNSDVKEITSWLLDAGIPVESERTLSIKEHFLIKQILALLGFLSSPIDDLAFAAFILGDIFGKITGVDNAGIRDFLFELRVERGKEREEALYSIFRKKYPAIWDDLIDGLFKSVGFVPLYELVITIYRRMNVIRNFPEYQGFFMKFLEIVRRKEEDAPGIREFLDLFERIDDREMYVSVPRLEAVSVLTVHKAKGLEFPVVIVPMLKMDLKVGAGSQTLRKPYIIRDGEGGSLRLAQLKKDLIRFSDDLTKEYSKEYARALLDELNSVYVALTRAEDELYVFIPQKSGNSRNIALSLFDENVREIGVKRVKAEKKKEGDEIMALGASEYSDWLSFLREETTDGNELVNRRRLFEGEVCHRMLSYILDLSGGDMDALIGDAVTKTVSEFPELSSGDISKYRKKITALVKDKSLAHIFSTQIAAVYNEMEVVDRNAMTKRMDRVIVTDKKAIVVDYKNSKGDYAAQVKEYMSLLKDIYPGRVVEGYLLYLDTHELEEC
ncbi:MAG: UvrD-helicase domain-containing protein [Candidatus Omnitrophica bacterium]|nr:UvrD-helicase domain-containing protein [Candidatus Omnitrophota bacterium]